MSDTLKAPRSKSFANYFIFRVFRPAIRLKRLFELFIKQLGGGGRQSANFSIRVVKKFWSTRAALVIAGGDVRGGAGDGALRESLLDLQQRQCYRNRPLDQSHGTRRSQCTLP